MTEDSVFTKAGTWLVWFYAAVRLKATDSRALKPAYSGARAA
jgi:hypothetical protein